MTNMIIEQKSGEEIKKLTGRSIIWSPNELGIPYLGLYEEHGKIGEEDYLRYGVRYIGNKTLNSINNERIIIGEIYGELLSLDNLVFRSKEYEYTELNSSLNWIWRYNGVVIDTRNITGILGFIQKTWKESDESNCQLEIIDCRLYVTSIPNICIYPGDELVLSVNNNMDLLIPTIGDELMKIRSRIRRIEQKLETMNYKESPKSSDATTVSVSSVSTIITKNKGIFEDNYEKNNSILIPYSLNCTNEYYCNFCSKNNNIKDLKISSRIYKNALVFILGDKESILNLTENQIHYFDRWKSTSCEKELYSLFSVHKINYKLKRGVTIESIKDEIKDNDQIVSIPIDILLVKNYISGSCSETLISEFRLMKEDINRNDSGLTKKFYISQSVLLYYYFDKWMNEKIIGEYKYLRIPIPTLIEQHRQLLLPYPDGVQWNLNTLSWRYYIQNTNSKINKYELNEQNSLESNIKDQPIQEREEYIGVNIDDENDSFELFKSYITICSIKYRNSLFSKTRDINSNRRLSSNLEYSMNFGNINKKKRIKENEDNKSFEYENDGEIDNYEFPGKIQMNNNCHFDQSNMNIHEIIEKCSEINNIDSINNVNKQLLNLISDDVNIISQQVEILLIPPYSSFIKFCSKRLGFSITYNKRRAWFSVRTRGVLEAFNLAIKWIKRQKFLNEKHFCVYSNDLNKNNSNNYTQNENLKYSIRNKKVCHKSGTSNDVVNYLFTKNEDNCHSDESDVDSVESLNEQANRLKPLPKRIIWVPSRRVFIVSYKRLGTINQMNTKSFNPTIYGGVKKALKHACIFQSQTENCKYNNFTENSNFIENSTFVGIQNKNINIDEKNKMDASLKPLNYWVKSIDSKVSPETVTNAYREAVSTYLTQSTALSQSNINYSTFAENCNEIDVNNNFSCKNNTPMIDVLQKENIDNGNILEKTQNSFKTDIKESYINNFNTDYIFNNESISSQHFNNGVKDDLIYKDSTSNNSNELFEYKPFKMYYDSVFLNRDSATSLMNIDENFNLYNLNNYQLFNSTTDGQTVVLDDEIQNRESKIDNMTDINLSNYFSLFDEYKISEPLISISDPHRNIIQFDDSPINLNDQLIKMVSPYDYIDSFTLIEP